jgi:Transposase IS116/IS110/IS902 family
LIDHRELSSTSLSVTVITSVEPSMATWPKGDRTILGKISRRGNRYLRVLFVQAAWVVLIKAEELGTNPGSALIIQRKNSGDAQFEPGQSGNPTGPSLQGASNS